MSFENRIPQYRAFIPENTKVNQRRLNDSNNQDILKLMKIREVEAYEVIESEVVDLSDGKKQLQQTRCIYMLTTNSAGQLSYIVPPNNIKVVTRDSKPLYLSEGCWAEIAKMNAEDDLHSHQISKIRKPTQNAWAQIMGSDVKKKDEVKMSNAARCLNVSFVVAKSGSTKMETIELYFQAIVDEITAAERKAQEPLERILCNGAVKGDDFILKGLRMKLEKIGYDFQTNDYPEDHSGHRSHKRVLVVKTIK